MKRIVRISLFGLGLAVVGGVLGGCPIYPNEPDGPQCASGSGSPNAIYSSECAPANCSTTAQCPSGSVCDISGHCATPAAADGSTPSNRCSLPSDCAQGLDCGYDGYCHVGDCLSWGCPNTGAYQCKLANGTAQCVPSGVGQDGGTGADGGPLGDAGAPGCQADAECSADGVGARCLDGACVKPADQCFDGTRCLSGEQCVQGVCTPSCDATHACPTGYGCDTSKGVCTTNPTACDATQACAGGNVCVEQHCVPPCANGSANGSSCGAPGSGLICVNGGCIPDQLPRFVCSTDGAAGTGSAGSCAIGSICLHHDCYISCAGDAGDAGSCASADKFNVCKQVTTSSGAHSVCGSSSNLGSDCDPTQGKACAGSAVCIDGYCR